MTQDVWFITKPTVTTKEAADIVGVTVQTILKKEKEGLIECVYKNNWKQFGSKIFFLEDIERLKNKEEGRGLSTKEAAEILNVATSTIFTYIKSGKLPATRVEKRGKQVYLIDEEELEIFMLDYEKTTTKERKTFVTNKQDADIYLYQVLTHQQTGKKARVIACNGTDGTVMTEEEEVFPLSTYAERRYSLEPVPKRDVITKRGYLSFTFKKPQLFDSITYNILNMLYQTLSVSNMRVSVTHDSIHVDIKPFLLKVNPLTWQEEIKYLHVHMKSGSIFPHVDGVYFKSNVEPLTFHAEHTFKQKVVQMAADAGMGQEEFLLHAVRAYLEKTEAIDSGL
ncbi:helix-turn-helix domain-containing protein [Bacillus toyonensis]|uniref:Excisionase n=1 Tax=Bacillus toyonensis TaxID=155322 RepID=A0A2A8H8R6_9BACI|nr:helix-turn-helix domain-containing protein [Bacillus toyonensis]PEP95261.1 excisionase [Bacillus toyonensis]